MFIEQKNIVYLMMNTKAGTQKFWPKDLVHENFFVYQVIHQGTV